MDAHEKSRVLAEALPYIRRFRGQTVVVKYGGNAMEDGEQGDLARFAEDVALLHSVGIKVVVVHGGGPQIASMLTKLGMESKFVDGLRVTDADTLDVVRMVLVGKVNRDIVSAVNTHGPIAVGVSGEDGSLLQVTQAHPELGYVGDVHEVGTGVLDRLLAQDLVPVVATIGVDEGGQSYNINADTAAGAIAEALGAAKLVYLTDIDGIRRDVDDPASRISSITAGDLQALVADGTVTAGMIPKVASSIVAVKGGVGHAHILDGRVAHALLLEIFTDEGVGTMVTSS
ncbi:MAG TPA: acetylglutamate kinase [Acidimicrobiales bacterium]|nr:acetylglutamate kinase [Acidimicrobiales bacterium]